MFQVVLVDPCAAYPQYDHQVWFFFPWRGTSAPMGRLVGEWVYVGKINETENEIGKREVKKI